MLHVTNGDAAAVPLRQAGLPGEVTIWADPLHDGPVVDGLSDQEWREMRAGFLAASGDGPTRAEVLATLAEWDAALARAPEHEEVVFWFEHDLFDQLILVRHLEWLARLDTALPPMSLVCIDRHPDVPRFRGLGQLSPAQLRALFPAREPITERHVAVALAGWAAFTSPDPTRIERLLATDTAALPFLPGALARHLEEFPAVRNGLPRTEQRALEALSAGPRTGGDLFGAVQDTEERVYMGDLSFYARLRDLARGEAPLIRAVASVPSALSASRETGFSITAGGRQVLEGRADWIRWNGIDRWLGGVHLQGRDVPWRWDTDRRRLVARTDLR